MSEPEKIKYTCDYCGNIVYGGSIMPSEKGCPVSDNGKHLWQQDNQCNI